MGGSGRKGPEQYNTSFLLGMSKESMRASKLKEAEEMLRKAFVHPENLGEGRLEGTKENHLYYYLGIVQEHLGKTKEAEECYLKALEGDTELAGAMYYDQPAEMILYQWDLLIKSWANKRSFRMFSKADGLWKREHEETARDFFAVSLPYFLIFDEDINKRNKAHCYYLIGLAYIGIDEKGKNADHEFCEAMKYDPGHLKSPLLPGSIKTSTFPTEVL